jgi:hypothetical protein
MPSHDFKEIQDTFTQRIRSADVTSLEGVEDRRLNIYRELFYNNVESFISGTFPVLKGCVSQKTWQTMVRRFFVEHISQSPYFLEISEEFLEYLAKDKENTLALPSYAYSLAHWEWMELFADAYVESNCHQLSMVNLDTDVLATVECAWLQAYEYAVHKIESDDNISQAPTFLLIYRDASQEVEFVELNPLSYILFEALQNNTRFTIQQIVQEIATAHNMPLQQLLPGAYETVSNWVDLQLIRKPN